MPVKRTASAKSQATSALTAKKKPAAEPKPSEVVRKIHFQVSNRLESEFKHFRKNANIEEKRLMIEILNDYMNRSGYRGEPRSPLQHEVYLYSAIERQLSDSVCVVVPRDEWMPYVEDFINELEHKSPLKKRSQPMAEDGIRDALEDQFRSEIELFARDAGRPSLRLMSQILARWNELERDPEVEKIPNVLAAAIEIELDKLRVKTAVKAVEAA